MTTPAVDVVIVSYNTRELLRRCLASLREHSPAVAVTTWVVDNGSTDGTVELVGREFPGVELIAADSNLGFAAANNLAIWRGSAPYVLALNPDTRVTAGALDRMLALMESDGSIGIAGCRLELEDGTFDHAARRSFPTPLSALGHFSGVGRSQRVPPGSPPIVRRRSYADPSMPSTARSCSSAGRRSRKSASSTKGTGCIWRIWTSATASRSRAGSTWYEPDATVVHVKGGTSGPIRGVHLNFAFHYGMLRFYRKHYARSHSMAVNMLVYAGIGVKLAAAVTGAELRRVSGGIGSVRLPSRGSVPGPRA